MNGPDRRVSIKAEIPASLASALPLIALRKSFVSPISNFRAVGAAIETRRAAPVLEACLKPAIISNHPCPAYGHLSEKTARGVLG